jgi:hypothetical protein
MRTGLDDQRIESFGSRVDGGRKTGRFGADDDDIAQVVPVDALVEAETVGNLRSAASARPRRSRSRRARRPCLCALPSRRSYVVIWSA